MADKKTTNKSKVKKTSVKKPKTTLRERNAKAAEATAKPKRVRKAAKTVRKPAGKVTKTLKQEFHVLPNGNGEGFFTKTRTIAPRYVHESLGELKHVTWPGFRETWKLVFAVFVFAIAIGLLISGLDFVMEKIFRQIIL